MGNTKICITFEVFSETTLFSLQMKYIEKIFMNIYSINSIQGSEKAIELLRVTRFSESHRLN